MKAGNLPQGVTEEVVMACTLMKAPTVIQSSYMELSESTALGKHMYTVRMTPAASIRIYLDASHL